MFHIKPETIMKRFSLFSGICSLAVVLTPMSVRAQHPAGVVGAGGGSSEGESMLLCSTFGQTVTGVGFAAAGRVHLGFWLPDASLSRITGLPTTDAVSAAPTIRSHPNPATGRTALRISVPVHRNVSLRLFDLLGRSIATLIEGEDIVGSKLLELDAGHLVPGRYTVVLSADGFNAVTHAIVVLDR